MALGDGDCWEKAIDCGEGGGGQVYGGYAGGDWVRVFHVGSLVYDTLI